MKMRMCVWMAAAAALAVRGGTAILEPGETVARHSFPLDFGESQTLTAAELDGRRAVLVAWDAARANRCEFGFAAAPKLPPFRRLRVTAEVWIPPEGTNAEGLSLRFRDAGREVSQLGGKGWGRAPGWRTLEYELDTAKPMRGSWPSGGTGVAATNRVWDGRIAFHNYAIGFRDRKSKGRIGLGKITAEVVEGPAEARVETDLPVPVLRPGNAGARLTIVNHQSGRKEFRRAEGTVTDADGRTVRALELPAAIAGGGTWSCALPAPETFGVWHVRVVTDDGAGAVTNEMRYCRMDPVGRTAGVCRGEFLFGVHGDTGWTEETATREAAAAALCGIKIRRCGAMWGLVMRPGREELDFSVFDKLQNIYYAHGIESQLIIGSHPGFIDETVPKLRECYPGGKPFRIPLAGRMVQLDKYSYFIEKLLEHCKGRVRFVESWNEPDIVVFSNFPKEHHARLQKACFDACRKADPNVKVLSAGWAAYRTPGTQHSYYSDYLRDVMDDVKDSFDVLAFHAHGPQEGYVRQVRGLKGILAEKGVRKPWLSNETAISSTGIGERRQAATLFKKFLYAWSEGALGYFWYDLRNNGFDADNSEHNYGLITHDFYPKQAYVAYNALAKLYTGARFVRAAAMPRGFQAFLFKSEAGEWLLPMWRVAHNGPARTFRVTAAPGARVRVRDLFGNERDCAADADGAFRVELGDTPVTVRVVGGAVPPAAAWDPVDDAKARRTYRVPAGEAFGAQPLQTMGGASVVVPLQPNVPDTMDLFWRNEDDLSAAVFAAAAKDGLRLRIVARDDIHAAADAAQVQFVVGGETQTFTPAPVRDAARAVTTYELTLPWATFGGLKSVPFNIVLTDADTDEAETRMSLAEDAAAFPLLTF